MTLHEQYPDVRQYLESVREARAMAKLCSMRVREMRQQCESITAPLRDSPVANGNRDMHSDSSIVALADMSAKLDSVSAMWLRRMDAVDAFIDGIPKAEYRIILRLRYVDCLRWEEVERRMKKIGLYYERAQVFRKHGAALQEARRIWNEERGHEDSNGEKEDQ